VCFNISPGVVVDTARLNVSTTRGRVIVTDPLHALRPNKAEHFVTYMVTVSHYLGGPLRTLLNISVDVRHTVSSHSLVCVGYLRVQTSKRVLGRKLCFIVLHSSDFI
jgi:hypothetical protein